MSHKQSTVIEPPKVVSKEQREWKDKYDKFKMIRQEDVQIRAMYFAQFDPPPATIPTIMLSIKLEYYLWRKSIGEEEWTKKNGNTHTNYEASQTLNYGGLSQNLKDIVDVYKEVETMAKVKVKSVVSAVEGNGHVKKGEAKKVFGKTQKVGKVKGLPISQTWVHYLTLNDLSDEEILEGMNKEFPAGTGINLNQTRLTSYRAFYNRGGYNKGIPPKLQSKKLEEEKDKKETTKAKAKTTEEKKGK